MLINTNLLRTQALATFQMPLPNSMISTASSLTKFLLIFVFLLCHGDITATQDDNNKKIMNIGAIIDANSRIGREGKVAMEIGIRDFNDALSNKYKLVLNVSDSGGDPLRAAAAADNLIKDGQIQAIIGMETWQEAALVAQVGNEARVPVISFATAAITPPLTSVRWPFLARMANNASVQLTCVAKIIGSYLWRRVIVVYEVDTYGGDSGIVTLLSDSLRDVGSEIEYSLALPPFSSLSDPKTEIRGELKKIQSKRSRVFVVLQSSMQLATHLFKEAKEMDLMGNDSVWIATDPIASLLNNVDSSVMSSMEGVIGIKSYFSETNSSFQDFSSKFRKRFQSEYPDEDKYEPGIYAIRAYDAISSVGRATDRLTNISTSKTLLQNILSSNFRGLSGEIQFEDGELSQNQVYRIINVMGKSCIELKLWSMNRGFGGGKEGEEKGALGETVKWPGGLLERAPLGWVMPSKSKPLLIGVPGNAKLKELVNVNKMGEEPTGFCIDVFEMAVKLLNCDLPYVFKDFYGKYDELVDKVYFEEYDAVVGDVTILANRSKYVEFTQPFAETQLSMIVPVKCKEPPKEWLFTKPFTGSMWLMTGAVFVYTVFIAWFLEHRSNPQFRGPWNSQLGTALWFTFYTFFSAPKERLRSNFTRIAIVVWFFVVFVVTSSYQANLTSILTVQRLQPTRTDIDSLRRNNSKVGCNGKSYVGNHLVQVLKFDPKNIINITSESKYNYSEEFKRGNIQAAFLELPFHKLFLSKYYKGYEVAGSPQRSGGLGFVFPKGSPFAIDISRAILNLSESGNITELEKNLVKSCSDCSNSDIIDNQSLSLRNFWGLFLLTGGTSTIVFLLYLLRLIKNFQCHEEAFGGTASPSPNDDSLWNRTKRIKEYYFNNGSVPTAAQSSADIKDCSSTRVCVYVSECNTPEHSRVSSPAEIELSDVSDAQNHTPSVQDHHPH